MKKQVVGEEGSEWINAECPHTKPVLPLGLLGRAGRLPPSLSPAGGLFYYCGVLFFLAEQCQGQLSFGERVQSEP